MSQNTDRNRIIFGISVALVVVVALTFVTMGTTNASSDHLKTFSSYDDLVNYIGNNSLQSSGGFYSVFNSMLKSDTTIAATQSSSDVSGYSGTNIQVQGVDEADTVKTDGQYLYVASGGIVYIINATPANQSEIVSKIVVNGTWQLDLYVSGNKLVILANQWGYMYPLADGMTTMMGNSDAAIMPAYYNVQKMLIQVYDITDRSSPVLVRDLVMDGSLSGSRVIGNYLYAVVSESAYTYNQTIILPTITDNNKTITIQATDVRYADIPSPYYNFITVVAVNISNDTAAPTHETFLASYTSSMYVSEDNMYITMPKYPAYVEPLFGITNQLSISSSGDSGEKTLIYKLSLNADNVTVEAQGSVPGTVLNQFSMDEFNGNFRIATTDLSTNGSVNNIYVLDNKLNIIGSLEGLAKGERIYSARFVDDRCYLVTYQQIDPFYVIDLATPTEPKVIGLLNVPGFSDYMQPYDQNTIIGVGRENNNVKLSLFDVTNVTSPREISKYAIQATWSYSDVSNNPKAFLFDKSESLLVIPVTASFADPYQWISWQGVCVFNITAQNGLVLKGTITQHQDIINTNGSFDINRALYIGNVLYTISDGMVQMNDLNSLTLLNQVLLH
ncbi:MAG: beta-propeller domain-containing protein [Candidatus Methanomethylicaceae archaeon]|jgi:uncharacterized secreted protein with C-terminal beta-propeller domain